MIAGCASKKLNFSSSIFLGMVEELSVMASLIDGGRTYGLRRVRLLMADQQVKKAVSQGKRRPQNESATETLSKCSSMICFLRESR
jgi:hypothetical protein